MLPHLNIPEVQVVGSLPFLWKTHFEFLALGFSPTQQELGIWGVHLQMQFLSLALSESLTEGWHLT